MIAYKTKHKAHSKTEFRNKQITFSVKDITTDSENILDSCKCNITKFAGGLL